MPYLLGSYLPYLDHLKTIDLLLDFGHLMARNVSKHSFTTPTLYGRIIYHMVPPLPSWHFYIVTLTGKDNVWESTLAHRPEADPHNYGKQIGHFRVTLCRCIKIYNTLHMTMSLTCIKMEMLAKHITIRMGLHRALESNCLLL